VPFSLIILLSTSKQTIPFLSTPKMGLTCFLVYVDGLIITGIDSKVVNQFIASLSHQFSVKDLGSLHYFLGVEVILTQHGVLLSQYKHTQDLLGRHKMIAAKEVSTPMQQVLL